MATAVEQGRRSQRRRMPKISNGRFYAGLATVILVTSMICNTITKVVEVMGR